MCHQETRPSSTRQALQLVERPEFSPSIGKEFIHHVSTHIRYIQHMVVIKKFLKHACYVYIYCIYIYMYVYTV